jgi:hypothetical protein
MNARIVGNLVAVAGWRSQWRVRAGRPQPFLSMVASKRGLYRLDRNRQHDFQRRAMPRPRPTVFQGNCSAFLDRSEASAASLRSSPDSSRVISTR